jgi:hypothetical protein
LSFEFWKLRADKIRIQPNSARQLHPRQRANYGQSPLSATTIFENFSRAGTPRSHGRRQNSPVLPAKAAVSITNAARSVRRNQPPTSVLASAANAVLR